MRSRAKRSLTLLAASVCTAILAGIWYTRSRPVGYFDSAIVGYHGDSKLRFENGKVSFVALGHQDMPLGEYERSNMNWVWHAAGGTEWFLKPGLFSLKCIDKSDQTNVFRLERRWVLMRPPSRED
jgi:hypothetical protein